MLHFGTDMWNRNGWRLHVGHDLDELPICQWRLAVIGFDDLVQVVKCVTLLCDHLDAEISAHGLDVLIADTAERLRVLLEGQVCRAPLLEQGRQRVGRLTSDHKQPTV